MDRDEDRALERALSKRERAVAARFAEGLTCREVGAALFIAPTTVRTHVAAIYRKLGVRNKAALASLFADHRARAAKASVNEAPGTPRAGRCGPPLVAVLPFDNLNGDARWSRLADGLTADIIADLARCPELTSVARHTMLAYKGRVVDVRSVGQELGADYVLEGSVQADAGRVRVAAQLADASTGAQLWSKRHDRPEGELFAIQDEVATSVANALGAWAGTVARAGRAIARRKPPASLEAYDLYLLGLEQKHLFTKASIAEAIRLLSRAVELDPGLARAWTALGLAHGVAALNAFTDEPAAANKLWRACAERALALDGADPIARVCMGELRALEDDLAGASEEHRQALAIAPGDADTLAFLAASFALVAGDPRQGAELGRRALELCPTAPPWYFSTLGRAEYVQGRYEDSIAALRRAPQGAPATLLFLAMAHAQLGEVDEAGRHVAQLRAEFPSFTVAGFVRHYPVTNPPSLAAIQAGAARAGLLPPG